MKDDHDKFMSKTPVAVNRLMQAEADRIAWSRLPLWKRTWLKTKRYFNLNDPYPYHPATYQRRDKLKAIVMTVIAMVGTAFVVVILLAYFGAVIMFFWSL